MSLTAQKAGAGLRTYSGSQWRVLHALANVQTWGDDEASGIVASLLLESERLGILPEARLLLHEISETDFTAMVVHARS